MACLSSLCRRCMPNFYTPLINTLVDPPGMPVVPVVPVLFVVTPGLPGGYLGMPRCIVIMPGMPGSPPEYVGMASAQGKFIS